MNCPRCDACGGVLELDPATAYRSPEEVWVYAKCLSCGEDCVVVYAVNPHSAAPLDRTRFTVMAIEKPTEGGGLDR